MKASFLRAAAWLTAGSAGVLGLHVDRSEGYVPDGSTALERGSALLAMSRAWPVFSTTQ
jgi:hypothetical protein